MKERSGKDGRWLEARRPGPVASALPIDGRWLIVIPELKPEWVDDEATARDKLERWERSG